MELTHFNEEGRARMVDVSVKEPTLRIARAAATVHMLPATMEKIRAGTMKRAMCSRSRRWPGFWPPRKPPT